MQKLAYLGLVVSLCFFSGCGSESANTTEETNPVESTEATPEEETEAAPDEEVTTAEETPDAETGKVIQVTYQSAAVYAASTEYAFETESGELILIRGPVYDEEPTIEIPDNMLETGEDIEGPPGANPELVGKKFNIYYDGEDNPKKIELAE